MRSRHFPLLAAMFIAGCLPPNASGRRAERRVVTNNDLIRIRRAQEKQARKALRRAALKTT